MMTIMTTTAAMAEKAMTNLDTTSLLEALLVYHFLFFSLFLFPPRRHPDDIPSAEGGKKKREGKEKTPEAEVALSHRCDESDARNTKLARAG